MVVLTSFGVFWFYSNLGAVVGKEGAVVSIPGSEGRIAQAWVNVPGGMRVFSENIWHSEGWTPRNEALMGAVVKQVRISDNFKKILWFEAGTCSSRRQVKASQPAGPRVLMASLLENRTIMISPVTEDQEYGSGGKFRIKTLEGGHLAGRKRQRIPGVGRTDNAGKLPGRSKVEEGREEDEERRKARRRRWRVRRSQERQQVCQRKLIQLEVASLGILYQEPRVQLLERILSRNPSSELGGRMI